MSTPFLIIGQGLAGSLLAWELMQREQSVLLLDHIAENSASRVAAGLINPVTGQRLVKSDEVDQCLPVAMQCYDRLQEQFHRQFYHPKPMLRLFTSQADKDRYLARHRDQDYQSLLGNAFEAGESGQPVADQAGGFQQLQTGYLDITALLDTLRAYFQAHEMLLDVEFDYRELESTGSTIHWRDSTFDRVIFCEGARAVDNPWFRWLPFQLAKGETITVRSSVTLPDAIINDGHWLLPYAAHRARMGATYTWEWSDDQPTQTAREQLLAACHRIIGEDDRLEVVEQRAGIRPATRDRAPLLGRHPVVSALHVFNGFGSKGAMTIPYYARCMADYLLCATSLPPLANIARYDNAKSVVVLARRYLSEFLREGDIVVDATVGNGHDTEFAARCVGSQGHVFGFDIQQQAIEKTLRRLVMSGLQDRVTLVNDNHERIIEAIPPQYHGQIACIMFNLGYLPGDNKQIVTLEQSTMSAIEQALQLLQPGGSLSIISYRGHAAGEQEASKLQAWTRELNADAYDVEIIENEAAVNSPILMLVHKLS